MAMDALIHVSQDERERAINRSRRMWQTDYESNMNTARESGRMENQRNVILNMLAKGFDDAVITEVVGWTGRKFVPRS